MKILLLITSIFITNILSAQIGLTTTEEIQYFTVGAKNSIVIDIPNANMDVLDKVLKSELKDWGGKYKSSKGERTMIQGSPKFMENKAFDAYVITLPGAGGNIRVAFAIDLGGAFLNSKDHVNEYNAMYKRILDFGKNVITESVKSEVKGQEKYLKTLNKEQKSLEEEKINLSKSIEDYKKKIADSESKILENDKKQVEKKKAILLQEQKIKATEKISTNY